MKHLLLLLLFSCTNTVTPEKNIIQKVSATAEKDFYEELSDAALALTNDNVIYDSKYYTIPYPNGDVPKGKGVCTDVLIRAYRTLGTDLQQEVHKDMKKNFSLYPKTWGLKKTDTNIDHRRVPNLQVFFTRHGQVKPITRKPVDYKPGDIVTWKLPSGVPHIGLVVNKKSVQGNGYQVVHNIGAGQVLEDCLFGYTITGHYRYKK